MRPFLVTLIIILVIFGLWILVDMTMSPATSVSQPEAGTQPDEFVELNDSLRVKSPRPDSVITSPLHIAGDARGSWYFEGVFGVELRDAHGGMVARSHTSAGGEWMTRDFVPFTARLTFAQPATETGTLIFRKANPSGLPENAASTSMPIRFGVPGENTRMQTLQVYFNREGVATCGDVVPVNREVEETTAVARAALTELLGGPTQPERAQGYLTSIPDGVEIQSLRIDDGVAHVDFNDALDRNVGGSCLVSAIYRQIVDTLMQFPTVDDVVLSVNGETETILQP